MAELGVEGRSLLLLSTLPVLSEGAEGLWTSPFPGLAFVFPVVKWGLDRVNPRSPVALICGLDSSSLLPSSYILPLFFAASQLHSPPVGPALPFSVSHFQRFLTEPGSSSLSPFRETTCPGA